MRVDGAITVSEFIWKCPLLFDDQSQSGGVMIVFEFTQVNLEALFWYRGGGAITVFESTGVFFVFVPVDSIYIFDAVAAGMAQVCKTEVEGSNPSSVICLERWDIWKKSAAKSPVEWSRGTYGGKVPRKAQWFRVAGTYGRKVPIKVLQNGAAGTYAEKVIYYVLFSEVTGTYREKVLCYVLLDCVDRT